MQKTGQRRPWRRFRAAEPNWSRTGNRDLDARGSATETEGKTHDHSYLPCSIDPRNGTFCPYLKRLWQAPLPRRPEEEARTTVNWVWREPSGNSFETRFCPSTMQRRCSASAISKAGPPCGCSSAWLLLGVAPRPGLPLERPPRRGASSGRVRRGSRLNRPPVIASKGSAAASSLASRRLVPVPGAQPRVRTIQQLVFECAAGQASAKRPTRQVRAGTG